MVKENNRRNPLHRRQFTQDAVDEQGKISRQGRFITKLVPCPEKASCGRSGFSTTQVVRQLTQRHIHVNLGHRVWTYCIYKSGGVNLHYKLLLFCQMEHINLQYILGTPLSTDI